MQVTPYLMFNGRAEEAARFYAEVFGGAVDTLHRYADFPPTPDAPALSPEMLRRVGHACVSIPGAEKGIGLADTALPDRLEFGTGHMLTANVASTQEAEKVWAGLTQGAQKIACPLQKTFYAEAYGELTDRFGVQWAVMYYPE